MYMAPEGKTAAPALQQQPYAVPVEMSHFAIVPVPCCISLPMSPWITAVLPVT
jgi:hypothetical protein